jgi:hypothetical protein
LDLENALEALLLVFINLRLACSSSFCYNFRLVALAFQQYVEVRSSPSLVFRLN